MWMIFMLRSPGVSITFTEKSLTITFRIRSWLWKSLNFSRNSVWSRDTAATYWRAGSLGCCLGMSLVLKLALKVFQFEKLWCNCWSWKFSSFRWKEMSIRKAKPAKHLGSSKSGRSLPFLSWKLNSIFRLKIPEYFWMASLLVDDSNLLLWWS